MTEDKSLCHCRLCGTALVCESRRIAGVSENAQSTELVYEKIMTCPKRLRGLPILTWRHDRRMFNDDCTEELDGGMLGWRLIDRK